MKYLAALVVLLGAAQAFAVSWDQADPAAGWKESLPRAQAAPAPRLSGSNAANTIPSVPQSAVDDALKVFKDLASDTWSLKEYGFASAAEVQTAVVAAELPQYFVGLTDLASFKAPQSPKAIMKLGNEALLIEANGRPCAVVMLDYYAQTVNVGGGAAPIPPGWRLGSIEGPVVAKPLDSILKSANAPMGAGAYLIYVPALHEATFVGVNGAAYSLWNEPSLGLKSGQSAPVVDLFRALRPLARTELSTPHNGPGA